MPLLCLVPLIFMGPGHWACLPTCHSLASWLTFYPRTLAIQRVVDTLVTSPLAAESGPWEERRHPKPCLLGVLPDPFCHPTMPRQLWALGSETKHASAHLLSWLPSSFLGLGSSSHCVLPIGRGPRVEDSGTWLEIPAHYQGEGPGTQGLSQVSLRPS